MSGHAHHAARHDHITQALNWATSALPEERRPHAIRQLRWRISDHLRCCHGLRRPGQRALPGLRRLADLHADLHRART